MSIAAHGSIIHVEAGWQAGMIEQALQKQKPATLLLFSRIPVAIFTDLSTIVTVPPIGFHVVDVRVMVPASNGAGLCTGLR
jgi:hypothetical protein